MNLFGKRLQLRLDAIGQGCAIAAVPSKALRERAEARLLGERSLLVHAWEYREAQKKGELGPPACSPPFRRAAFPSRLRAIR